jgi:hypothetical protein
MTREEFEAAYAARSGVTVAWLHAHGRRAESCACGDEFCEGWAMAHADEGDPFPWITKGGKVNS